MAGRAAEDAGPVEILGWDQLSGDAAALAAWRELAVARGNPFAAPEWVAACVEGGADPDPIVLAARGGDGFEGFLALSRQRGSLAALRLPGDRLADWYEPACAPAGEERFLAGCAAALAELGCGALRLCRWGGAVEPLCAAGLRARPARPGEALPFVDLAGGWEEYLAGRSRNFRSQLGRRRRKLEKDRGLEFALAGPDTLDADWETFRRLHGVRWAERGESGLLEGEGGRVHRAFAAAAMERGWLRLWTMRAGGEPVGAWYGWRLGERYGYQLSGFDPDLAKAGVGTVLLAHTIEQAAAEGARIYDLLWGDESYKSRFETGRRELPSLLLSRPGSAAGIAARAGIGLRAAGRRLPAGLRRVVAR